MFCNNCGTQLDDNAKFCGNCGALTGNYAPADNSQVNSAPENNFAPNQGYYPNQNMNQNQGYAQNGGFGYGSAAMTRVKSFDFNNVISKVKEWLQNPKNVGIAAIGAVVLVVLIILLSCSSCFCAGSSGYKQAAKNYMKAVENEDGRLMFNTIAPYMNDILIDEEDLSKKELIDEYNDMLEDVMDEAEDEYGDRVKISYKVVDCEKFDKDELEDYIEDIEWYFDYSDLDMDDYKISAACDVDLEVKIKGSDDSDENTITLTCVKVNGRWYVAEGGMF